MRQDFLPFLFVTEQNITIDFKARYFLLGTPSPAIKHVWFVCHGYGQLAHYFIKKFQILDNGTCLIVAPEGLSRFYLQGFSGRVGATWMTKEARENDITNYITYLNTVAESIIDRLDEDVHITLLGFSQGAATAARWITQSNLNFRRLILWAGIFPEDLDIISARKKLSATKTFLVIGDQDPLISPDISEKQAIQYEKLGTDPEVVRFTGGHEINEGVLKSFER